MHTEQNASCFQDLWNLLMEQIKKSNEMRYELIFLLIWFRCLLFHTNKNNIQSATRNVALKQ